MAKHKNQSSDDVEVSSRIAEVKVSSDGGETWFRRKINMAVDLEESGLRPGEIFQINEDQYKVFSGDDGLQVEKLKNPISHKQPVIRRQ